MEIRKEYLDEICSKFNQNNEDISNICQWLRTTLIDKNSIEFQGRTYTRPLELLDVVVKNMLLITGYEMISIHQESSFYGLMKQYVNQWVKNLEITPFFTDFFNTFKGYGFDFERLISYSEQPWVNIRDNIDQLKDSLKNYIESNFLKSKATTTALISEIGIFTKEHMNLYAEFGLDIPKEPSSYHDINSYKDEWNKLARTVLFQYIDKKLGNVFKQDAIATLRNSLNTFIENYDFSFMSVFQFSKLKTPIDTIVNQMIIKDIKGHHDIGMSKDAKPLTDEQIKMILSSVNYTGVYDVIKHGSENKVKDNLLRQLQKSRIETKYIPKLKSIVQEKFARARVSQGYRAGMIAAQAVGENASQAGLRSFHHAGITGASGFERIEDITNMKTIEKSTNPFTSIALKGQPSFMKATNYANYIQATYISDICRMEIGRRDVNVPNIIPIRLNEDSEIGNAPIYDADKEGWQQKSLNFILNTFSDMKKSKRPKERPEWILRLYCDRDEMYQRKISMGDIANRIEDAIDNCRVVVSNISIGLIDIYTVKPTKGVTGDPDEQIMHGFLSIEFIPRISSLLVKGISNFSKTIVEKYNIISFVKSVNQTSDGFLVLFTKDVIINGVPKRQLIAFLKEKAGKNAIVTKGKDKTEFYIKGSDHKTNGSFLLKIRTPTMISFRDMIKSKVMVGTTLKIQLDRNFIRKEHEIPVDEIIDMVEKQNILRFHISVDISFDRNDFIISIKPATYFNSLTVKDDLKNDPVVKNIVDGIEIINDDQFKIKLNDENATYMDYILNMYSGSINGDINEKEFVFTLQRLSVEKALDNMISFQGNDVSVMSKKIDHNSYRFRIMARGVSTIKLAKKQFVNIYATIPSVPWEHYDHFDIEVTKIYALSELILNAGGDVGARHLSLLASTLTYIGYPIKMKLSGKKATAVGPIATAALEQMLNQTFQASSSSSVDTLTSAAGMTLIGDLHRTMQDKANLAFEKEDSAIDILMKASETVKRDNKTKRRVKRVQNVEEDASIREFVKDEGLKKFMGSDDTL
tara:strand:- start:9423 stop:12524 length:3102 start_codon:yes stop_codon:yes gene_type:complete